MITALVIVLLILLNGLFVTAEFAIVGAPRAAIDRLASQNHRTALRVQRVLRDPRRQDRYIATAQLGITLASLGLGMYGEHALAEWLYAHLEGLGSGRWFAAHGVASVLAVAFLTYFHIVLGEMVPKSLALQHAEQSALRVTPIMLVIQQLMFPLVLLLNGIGNMILRLAGIRRVERSREQYHTAEELEYIIRESHEGGLLRAESAQVLRELFDFSDLTAGEVMVPRVHVRGIPGDASREALEELLQRWPHSRYPLYEGDLDHIRGVIGVKDLLHALVTGADLGTIPLRPVAYLPESAPLDTVLDTMHDRETEFVVVMDEHGGTSGIVTVEDLFEEIVGEIEEGVGLSPDLFRDRQGRLHVAGTFRVEDLGEHLQIPLAHEEVDTVSGLVLALLNRPPQVGDRVEYEGVAFEVRAIEGQGVRECIVTPPPPASDSEDNVE